jgi:hypothetical protein
MIVTSQQQYGEMESLSSDMEKMRIKWRQDKVLELCSKGHNQSEIARILQVGVAIISRDVHYIQQDLYDKRKEFGEQVFAEYQKSLYGLDQVLKKFAHHCLLSSPV